MQAARDQFDISERQACRFLRINRRMIRYVRVEKNDAELRGRLEELAAERAASVSGGWRCYYGATASS